MIKITNLLIVLALLFAGYSVSNAQVNELSQTEQEERAVVYATMQFYAASEGQYKNKPEVVSEIWSSREDVTYMP
ncbi:MAG: hypothetical protein AAF462_11615, partial [Thermodesulfobacteriota bacterium]